MVQSVRVPVYYFTLIQFQLPTKLINGQNELAAMLAAQRSEEPELNFRSPKRTDVLQKYKTKDHQLILHISTVFNRWE